MRYATIAFFLASAWQVSGAAAAGLPMSQAPEIRMCLPQAESAPAICEPQAIIQIAADTEKRPQSIAGMTPIDDSAPCPIEPPFFLPAERAEPALPGCRAYVATQPPGSSALATALAKQGLLEFSTGVYPESAAKKEQGRATIEKALAIDPDNLTALLAKVEILQLLGAGVEARPAVEHLKALYPDEPRVRSEYAKLMRSVGSPEEELAALDSALQIAPDDMNLHRQRAELLGRIGREDEALAEFDLMIDTWPQDGYALFERAKLEFARGNAKAAVADAERAKGAHYSPAELEFLLIQANLMLGDLEKALAATEFRFTPQYETPLLALYRFSILDRLGRKKEAEAALAALAGERNEHILKIQVFLRNMGFDDVPISGTFDETTRRELAACLVKGACSETIVRAI